jgi:hypothetical protein
VEANLRKAREIGADQEADVTEAMRRLTSQKRPLKKAPKK